MNKIIPASRLAEILAEKANIPVSTATKYINQYFAAIFDALEKGNDVDIKGLGHFRLTGDAVEPIEFSLDDEARHIVNEPFEAFTPVEIAEGEDSVIFDLEEPIEEKPTELAEPGEPSTVPQPSESPEVNKAPKDPNDLNDPKDPNAHLDPISPIIQEPTPVVDSQVEVPPTVAAPEPPQPPTTPPTTSPVSNYYYEDEKKPCGVRCGWFAFWVAFALITGMVIGFFIGGNTKGDLSFTFSKGQAVDTALADTTDDESVEIVEDIDTSTVDTIAVPAPKPTETSTPKDVNEAKTEQAKPVYDTITQTTFLTSLARRHYGQMEYWVYIYDANNLGNPNRIAPGTLVRIPDISELPLTGNKEADVAAAKKRAREIDEKYKK